MKEIQNPYGIGLQKKHILKQKVRAFHQLKFFVKGVSWQYVAGKMIQNVKICN